ncbi:MAG TPA: flagellin [Phenylobacterium sp.]
MGLNSIMTNVGAMTALQTLAAINAEMLVVQKRITTGLKVEGPRDNGGTWAIAQMYRSESSGLGQVIYSLSRGQSVVDVALAAADGILGVVDEMRQLALEASDFDPASEQRAMLNGEYLELRKQVDLMAAEASFNGVNLISAGGTDQVRALADTKGGSTINVNHEDLSMNGAALSGLRADLTGAILDTELQAFATAQTSLTSSIWRLGSGHRMLKGYEGFIEKKRDTIDAAVGNLVDADLAKESARWQSLQVRQQLTMQALAIANRAPTALLQLFRF